MKIVVVVVVVIVVVVVVVVVRNSLHHYHDDSLSNDVTGQLLYQVPGDAERVCVQWSNEVMLGCGDGRPPASVAYYVTLLINSNHSSPARYLYPARHQLASPGVARLNVATVIVTHQLVKLRITHLQ